MGLHVDELAAFLACSEYHCTVDEGEESVVLTHSDVETRVMHRATLALQDVACLAVRATKYFNTESFAF